MIFAKVAALGVAAIFPPAGIAVAIVVAGVGFIANKVASDKVDKLERQAYTDKRDVAAQQRALGDAQKKLAKLKAELATVEQQAVGAGVALDEVQLPEKDFFVPSRDLAAQKGLIGRATDGEQLNTIAGAALKLARTAESQKKWAAVGTGVGVMAVLALSALSGGVFVPFAAIGAGVAAAYGVWQKRKENQADEVAHEASERGRQLEAIMRGAEDPAVV